MKYIVRHALCPLFCYSIIKNMYEYPGSLLQFNIIFVNKSHIALQVIQEQWCLFQIEPSESDVTWVAKGTDASIWLIDFFT